MLKNLKLLETFKLKDFNFPSIFISSNNYYNKIAYVRLVRAHCRGSSSTQTNGPVTLTPSRYLHMQMFRAPTLPLRLLTYTNLCVVT